MANEEPEGRIERLFRERKPIERAMRRAAREAAILHKQRGVPMAVWRDGKVHLIPPEEIEMRTTSSRSESMGRIVLGSCLPLALAGLLLMPAAARAEDDAHADCREKIAALEARVAQLEAENQALRERHRELEVLAGLVPQEDRVVRQERRLEVVSDPETGGESVVTRPARLRVTHGSRAHHYLSLRLATPAEDSASPAAARLVIQAPGSGSIYQRLEQAVLEVDGRPLALPVKDYQRDAHHDRVGRQRVDRSDQTLTFHLSPEELRMIAEAQAVIGRLGPVRFELDQDQIALFKALAQRIER